MTTNFEHQDLLGRDSEEDRKTAFGNPALDLNVLEVVFQVPDVGKYYKAK